MEVGERAQFQEHIFFLWKFSQYGNVQGVAGLISLLSCNKNRLQMASFLINEE